MVCCRVCTLTQCTNLEGQTGPHGAYYITPLCPVQMGLPLQTYQHRCTLYYYQYQAKFMTGSTISNAHNFSTFWWILTFETLRSAELLGTTVILGLFPDIFGCMYRKLQYLYIIQLQQPWSSCCCCEYNHISATLCATIDINVSL